jgi:hypothetical protein
LPFCEERHGVIKKSWTHEGPSKIKKQKKYGNMKVQVYYTKKIIAP